jgi:copper chaperone NosL
MGAPEIVPFSARKEATSFAAINGGTVMRLDDIPDGAVLAPVALVENSDDADFERRQRALSRKLGE